MKPSDLWNTPSFMYPKSFFDPCPVQPTFDGLSVDWVGDVFCNPPYSQVQKWLDKAIFEKRRDPNRVVVLLLPAWTDRKWFKDVVLSCTVFFSYGRLPFAHQSSGVGDGPRNGSLLAFVE